MLWAMSTPIMSDVTTEGVRVGARAYYLPDESNEDKGEFYFGYRILILNGGDQTVQILSRHWEIIDSEGGKRVVDGPGVVGEQPILEPNRAFKYTSFCKLPTHWGTMEGFYRVRRDDGSEFEARIGRFWLTTENQT